MEHKMTKADFVAEISAKLKMREEDVQSVIEEFMKSINRSLSKGHNVYLRGFATFYLKKRAQKIGRNVKANKPVIVPEHYIPAYKPSKQLLDKIKKIKINDKQIK